MDTKQKIKRGEFFETIKKIVTEDEAWKMLLHSLKFENNFDERHTYFLKYFEKIEKLARENLKNEWMDRGISHYKNFHLRSDGLVEIRG